MVDSPCLSRHVAVSLRLMILELFSRQFEGGLLEFHYLTG